MRRRRVYLIVVGLVLAGVIVAFFHREREPEYAGKRLSEWVKRYSENEYDQNLNLRTDEDAQLAVAHIGTNALPYLLKWIRYETPPWKTKLFGAVNSSLAKLNPDWGIHDEKAVLAFGALRAFGAFGPGADGAIVQLLKHSDPRLRAAATNALRDIDPDALGKAGNR